MFEIGNQRVGIVTDVPVLDGGDPVVSEFGEVEVDEAKTTEQIIWKDGCLFAIQTVSEAQGLATTTSAPARAFFPVDADTKALQSEQKLRYPYPDGDLYVMRGDAITQTDIDGRQDHVLAICERQEG